MKIRTSLALKITGVTAVIILALLTAVYFILKPHIEQLWHILLPLFALALIVLALSAFLLSHSALKPIRDVIDRMGEISATQFDTRLPVQGHGTDEIGELSTAFNELLDRLEASFKAQKMFVSNVSHELRTPLASLIGELDLVLLKDRTNERYKFAMENALKDARRMNRLIDGLLNLAKADYQKEAIVMEEIRLDEILLDVRDFLLRAHPDYEINLMFASENDDDRAITVNANEYLLSIALSNLIDNNCKYSQNRTSFVQISSWGEHAALRFSDNGTGISQEDMKKMFDVFYRGESKEGVEGYGIGLALVQKIIALHEGTIRVFSTKGEGTTFLVNLPHI